MLLVLSVLYPERGRLRLHPEMQNPKVSSPEAE